MCLILRISDKIKIIIYKKLIPLFNFNLYKGDGVQFKPYIKYKWYLWWFIEMTREIKGGAKQ